MPFPSWDWICTFLVSYISEEARTTRIERELAQRRAGKSARDLSHALITRAVKVYGTLYAFIRDECPSDMVIADPREWRTLEFPEPRDGTATIRPFRHCQQMEVGWS